MDNRKKEFIRGLYEIGAVKFGSFIMKSGIESPFYLDLRKVVSYPKLHRLMCGMLSDKAAELDFDVVMGIPYTALPSAAAVADRLEKPLLMLRKEKKTYGAGGLIVGDQDLKGRCLIVDDLITTGSSKFETADSLRAEGFGAEDILVVIDRSSDADVELRAHGLKLHSLISLDELVDPARRRREHRRREGRRDQGLHLESGVERQARRRFQSGERERCPCKRPCGEASRGNEQKEIEPHPVARYRGCG